MKCFTVTELSVKSHIIVCSKPYSHVGVGESGRGRSYSRVPLGKQDFPDTDPPKVLERASVIKTRDRGTILIVREKPDDTRRALVLIQISAGYRGSTTWSGVTTFKTPCKRRGEYVSAAACPSCGIDCKFGATRHPDEGMAYDWPSFPPEGVSVLSEGFCAQGAAGRMGGHVERLLIMEPGSMLRVARQGRLYGAPSKRYLVWTGEELKLGCFDELFPASEDEEQHAELL